MKLQKTPKFSIQTATNRVSPLGLQGSKLDKKPPALLREYTTLNFFLYFLFLLCAIYRDSPNHLNPYGSAALEKCFAFKSKRTRILTELYNNQLH
jgi:hypothetical protein